MLYLQICFCSQITLYECKNCEKFWFHFWSFLHKEPLKLVIKKSLKFMFSSLNFHFDVVLKLREADEVALCSDTQSILDGDLLSKVKEYRIQSAFLSTKDTWLPWTQYHNILYNLDVKCSLDFWKDCDFMFVSRNYGIIIFQRWHKVYTMSHMPLYQRNEEPVWGRGSYDIHRSPPPLQGAIVPPYSTTVIHSTAKPPTESDIYKLAFCRYIMYCSNRCFVSWDNFGILIYDRFT